MRHETLPLSRVSFVSFCAKMTPTETHPSLKLRRAKRVDETPQKEPYPPSPRLRQSFGAGK